MTDLQKLAAMALIEDNKNHKIRLKLKKQRQTFLDERGIIENSLISPRAYNYIVDLREKPVSIESFQNKDPNVRGTRGFYSIKYIPSTDIKYKEGLHFQIGQDLIRWRVLCSGYPMWKALAKRIPELGWLDRNSTLSSELFGIAQCHPGMPVWFTIKWEEYTNKINAKAEEENIDIDKRPLVAYKCSQSEYEAEYKGKELADIKEYNDYAAIYNQTRKEITEHGK